MPRIGIVAGEVSGDLLGAGLITALKSRVPDIYFDGVAGPRMVAAGCHTLYPMERLSVMGLVEVLGRYRELSRLRRRLVRHYLDNPPDVFIGIDSPDFNLGLEKKLHVRGIRTVHYVSPQVWAWRPRRARQIRKAVSLMLTLFPFESEFYHQQQVPVEFVGHPLADMIPLTTDSDAARRQLALPAGGQWVALLPGSRMTEVTRLTEPFLLAALECLQQQPDLKFVMPVVSEKVRDYVSSCRQRLAPGLPLRLVDGQAREVMAAADVVLLASGTATLEAMLLNKPMVVAYRLSAPSYAILRRLVSVRSYALPNLLCGDRLVPELIQNQATPAKLAAAVLRYLRDAEQVRVLQDRFRQVHRQLARQANETAAQAVLSLIGR